MYAWLWNHLPGRWPVRVLLCAVLFVAATLALMEWVFPEIAPYMPFNDATLDDAGAS
ncbi:hypothetical protein LWF01_16955 [Saxibacter everestensis]|uniref:Uncharacterized protein n=1 Tax=Saxibacter everestensis TaxID=2909229 RepID=A0ABY8QRY2_9MICO|nr:hypothetical protein LWF01_16955 [Brevibacteriaceae bacterium ZFBP1038]